MKSLLSEQLGGRDAVFKQGKVDNTGLVVPFNAKKIASLIYNAKDLFWDDEELAKNAIVKNIKNTAQYKQVSAEFQKLSGKKGLGEYLRSFMNLNDRLEIAGELMNVLPQNQWEWTIKKIVPWEDFKHVNLDKTIYNDYISGDTPKSALADRTVTDLIVKVYNKEWPNRGAELTSETAHNALFAAQIVSAFIPVVGWAISAGIGGMDSALYYKEGNSQMGGLMLVFSAMPGMGKLINKIPGVKQLGKKGMEILARKIGAKVGSKTAVRYSKLEQEVLKDMAKNDKFIKMQLTNYLRTNIKQNTAQIVKSKISQTAKNGLYNFLKFGLNVSPYVGAAAAYPSVYNYVTMPSDVEIEQTGLEYLDKLYYEETKNKK
jgi:hypothetical protein